LKVYYRIIICFCLAPVLTGFSKPICDGMPQLLLKAGRVEEAILFFDSKIKAAPDTVAPYQERAFFFLKINRKEEALQDFSKIIQLTPDSPAAYISRAFINSGLGRTEKADADFRKACALGDQSGCSFAGESNAGGK
jgi:tetratricopeptide (TPR) repeat protein